MQMPFVSALNEQRTDEWWNSTNEHILHTIKMEPCEVFHFDVSPTIEFSIEFADFTCYEVQTCFNR